MQYTAYNTLRIAKRYQNTKRSYLLVNPLQAKHIPVSPSVSLSMMRCLGKLLKNKYSHVKLIIGFAETATAIGAAAAECFGNECMYIHTTREELMEGDSEIDFLEEHSHAVEQKLCGTSLQSMMSNSPQIIFIDDELSTGKTLINIISMLRERYPFLSSHQLIAASVINRLTDENMARLNDNNIACEYLVKLPDADYTARVSDVDITAADDIISQMSSDCEYTLIKPAEPLMNPRRGVSMQEYRTNCIQICSGAINELAPRLTGGANVLVLGTEECMYPALIMGKLIEDTLPVKSVFCHATTRSPIGIGSQAGYPITEGYRIRSFYDLSRTTYIYDLAYYDAVIVVSDAGESGRKALYDLAAALSRHGCGRLYYLEGGENAQHIPQ